MVDVLDSDLAIALNYTPAAIRNDCAAISAVDTRLGNLVASTREAQLGIIRLAWWRNALASYDRHRDHPDPDLQQIAKVATLHRLDPATLSLIAEGWMAIAGGEDSQALADYAQARGDGLFWSLAAVMGGDVPSGAGSRHALSSFAWRCSNPVLRSAAIDLAATQDDVSISKSLRPLALLDQWAKSDIDRLRSGKPHPSPRSRAVSALSFAFLRR